MIERRDAKQMKQIEQVFQIVNHDLRNPLLNIRATIEELQLDIDQAKAAFIEHNHLALAESLHEALPLSLDLLKTATSRMDTVLDGVGDLFQCMFIDIEPERVDMLDMFQRCATALRLERDGIVLRMTALPDVLADPLAVKRIVMEILSNACRAIEVSKTSCKEIEVISRQVTGLQTAEWVCFEIYDSGCGFDQHELTHVFEPFFSGNHFGAAHVGMGLSRAYALVGKHGGDMSAESDSGRSVVRFSLPSFKI